MGSASQARGVLVSEEQETMSDDHRAAVSTASLGRSDAIIGVSTRLREHGLVFDGSIRGLHWDDELGSFSYDDEDGHDLDGLDSLDAALHASEAWEHVCLDFFGLSSSCELHVSGGRSPSESNVSLILPNSLYKLAASEVRTARRLIHVFEDVREVLGAELLVCGTQVPELGTSFAELRQFVDRELRDHVPTSLRLHTIVSSPAIDEDLRRRYALAEYWRRLELSRSARAVSQLPIDE